MSANLISLSSIRPNKETPWAALVDGIVIGKDILELLSSSMYVDPMSIYREYIQNAADSIDEARALGVLGERAAGRVEIEIDVPKRSIRIRDSGTGISKAEFVKLLVAFGASTKRGRNARGFRGVGRLAGLGYCQELLFRSGAQGEPAISEMLWDCRKLRALLRAADSNHHLRDVVMETVSTRSLEPGKGAGHFFEVEMRGVIRHRNDQLLDPTAVTRYLSQVAPVPFSPDFRYGGKVCDALKPYVKLGELRIELNGGDSPTYRPHRDTIPVGPGGEDKFEDFETVTVPALDGGVAAVGWVLHHGYAGALAPATGIKGLRVRCGNIQVGDDRIFEELFMEPRFNSWTVGEIHVVDARILPNGRRDHFEQNAHYQNLLTHLTPLARELSRRCRTSSIKRNRSREFLRQVEVGREKLAIIKQGAVSRAESARLLREVRGQMPELEKIATGGLFDESEKTGADREIQKLNREIRKLGDSDQPATALANIPKPQRLVYEKVFSLIYECAPNRVVAKLLVDRIMARLGTKE
ncbi:MAG TPA: ATP-binding protein [Bryobacteraceae bacterium]